MRRFLLIGLALVASPLALIAQTASVGGIVLDPTGAALPKVSIEFRNQDTGVRRKTSSNGTGSYLIDGIEPGSYDATVQISGFKTLTRDGVVFHVGDNLRIDFRMQVGDSTEHVDVSGGGGLQINTTDGSVSTVIDQTYVANIPLNGRSLQDLISLTPGIVTSSPQLAGGGDGGDFSVNGQRTGSNYYQVDGVSGNTSAGQGTGLQQVSTSGSLGSTTALGTTQSLVSLDALQEFRVESSTYSAEYGRNPGGQFVMLTRSGTNAFHGTAFDYLRNNFFDANDWFNDHYHTLIPALRQNDFGGTFGGRIFIPKLYDGKDKSFFFVSYEGLRLTQPQAATVLYVPDATMRSTAAPAIQPIINAFPQPTPNGIDYGSLAQFIAPYSLPSRINATSIRGDQVLSSWLTMFFRYAYTPTSTGGRSLSSVSQDSVNTQTYTLGLTAQVATNKTNEFRLGYARSDSLDQSSLDSFGGATPVNLAQAFGLTGYSSAAPDFLISVFNVGTSSLTTQDTSNRTRQWNTVDTFAWSKGRNQFKFGIDFRSVRSPVTPPDPSVLALYSSAARVKSGIAFEVSINKTLPSDPMFYEMSAFAQDEWRVTPALNLSLGLRWELDPPPHGADGRDAYTALGNLGNTASITVAPEGTPLWNTTKFNFAPRLGVAWQAHRQPNWQTVVRSGVGVFFDTDNLQASQGFAALGFSASGGGLFQSLPISPSLLAFAPSATAPYTGSALYAFPAHLQLPYTLQWNGSVQQGFGKSQSVTMSYVASNGRRLIDGDQYVSPAGTTLQGLYFFQTALTSNYQSLQVEYQRTINHGLTALGSYTWSHSIDYGSFSAAFPATRGNSDFDVRHNFQGGLSWTFPKFSGNRILGAVINDWGADARLNVRTAFPVNPMGFPVIDPVTGLQVNAGINLVPGQPIYLYGNYPGGRAINKAAFASTAAGVPGNAPRNFIRGFGETQLNMSARREFHLARELKLQFRAEAFNIANHPNFGYVDPTLTDANFGQVTKMLNNSLGTLNSSYQQGGARSMQFALKLLF